MTSYKQLELEHAVLQGRVGELEEARVAAETRATDSAAAAAGCGQRANMSAVSSADMYAHLANSSDWSARQMGAIEGTLADEPNDILCAMKPAKHLYGMSATALTQYTMAIGRLLVSAGSSRTGGTVFLRLGHGGYG